MNIIFYKFNNTFYFNNYDKKIFSIIKKKKLDTHVLACVSTSSL